MFTFFFYGYGDQRNLHGLTHSFPTRRSSDLFKPSEQLKLEGERLAARDKAREAQDPTKRASMAKQDTTESRAAAEQFLSNSHRENETDPQFTAAQSHVLATSIEAKTPLPKKDEHRKIALTVTGVLTPIYLGGLFHHKKNT